MRVWAVGLISGEVLYERGVSGKEVVIMAWKEMKA